MPALNRLKKAIEVNGGAPELDDLCSISDKITENHEFIKFFDLPEASEWSFSRLKIFVQREAI